MNKKRFGVDQRWPALPYSYFNPRSYREGYLTNQTAVASEQVAGCPPLFMGILPKPSLLSGSLLRYGNLSSFAPFALFRRLRGRVRLKAQSADNMPDAN